MNIKKIVIPFLSLRVLVLIITAALPLTGPHEWRQFDTVGMTYRYFIEIFQSTVDKYPFFIPAVMQAGDYIGITAAELPIINFFLSPLFYFGLGYGKFLIIITLLAINIQLFYKNYKIWKDEDVLGEKIEDAFLLLPILSFALIYFGKFMPDIFSVQLCLLSLGIAVKENKYLKASLIGSIGLMIKPTSIIVYALLFLTRHWKNLKHYFWISCSVIVTILYYKVGNQMILDFSKQLSFFATGPKPMGVAINEVISNPGMFFTDFLRNFFGKNLIGFFVAATIFAKFKHKRKVSFLIPLSLIILLQWSFLHLLSGKHPYQHNYYYIGMMPIVCILTYRMIKISPPLVGKILLALIIGLSIQESIYNLKPLFKPNKKLSWKISKQCPELIKSTPQVPWKTGYHFRSNHEIFPVLGMCFGEIQNSKKTKYGFFYKNKGIPNDCKETLAESEDLVIKACR